ncbi:MAG: integration host factor subunit alpha [Pelagibacterales bacterium]|nr:integration host factor subunit alpha [Pelagibacterales bacterium]RCL83503.1 MAG: integration host factor subunit alpha [Alphaproteobacteria bacterium]|tara:strand:- start:178 stop:468 length:291 start_codon:yes stop_codon:yes gene_type:complete
MKKTITREHLANCIKEELGLSRSDSLQLISITLNTLSSSLKKDKILKIAKLGTFKIKDKNSRIGRNPKTGKESIISARSVVTFNASEKVKSRLNLE